MNNAEALSGNSQAVFNFTLKTYKVERVFFSRATPKAQKSLVYSLIHHISLSCKEEKDIFLECVIDRILCMSLSEVCRVSLFQYIV